jgi:hypothetical protein
MAFIRKRISPSRRKTPSYQIIETYREDGKVKQRVLANLGPNPTPEEALCEFRKELQATQNVMEELRRRRQSGHDSSTRQISDRNFEKWSRACARQRISVEKLEALISSGKNWRPREKAAPDPTADSTSFLEWVIDRNSRGWF